MATRINILAPVIIALFCLPVYSARLFDRRSGIADVPSISTSGWTPPIDGEQTCVNANDCSVSLPPPADNKTLTVLAFGRGTFNYSCEEPANAPSFVAQYTELYDASALIPLLQNEEIFHTLVQEVYEFDYGQLKNSSWECLGSIGTLDGTAVITLYDIDTFEANLEETAASPDDPESNGLWAHSRSPDDEWEMYRLEMVGGAVPTTCQGQNLTFEINYAAEYWFYRA